MRLMFAALVAAGLIASCSPDRREAARTETQPAAVEADSGTHNAVNEPYGVTVYSMYDNRFVYLPDGMIDYSWISEFYQNNNYYEDTETEIYKFQDGRSIFVLGNVTGGTIGNFFSFYLVEETGPVLLFTAQGELTPRIEPDLIIATASWGYFYSAEERTGWRCRIRLDPVTLRVSDVTLLDVTGLQPPEEGRASAAVDLCPGTSE